MQHSTVRQHTLVATHSGDTGDRTHALHSAACTVLALSWLVQTVPDRPWQWRLPVLCYLCCCRQPLLQACSCNYSCCTYVAAYCAGK